MNCLRATERSPRFHDEAEEAGERRLFIEESLKKKKQGIEKETRGRKKISEFPSCPFSPPNQKVPWFLFTSRRIRPSDF